MARIKGTTVQLHVSDGESPQTFTALKGQRSSTFGGATNVADTTDKDNDGWQTGEATTRSGTVSVSGQREDPDTTYDTIRTAWEAGSTIECRLVDNVAGTRYWLGTFQVTNFQETAEVNDVVAYEISLTPTAALDYVTP